MSRTRDEWRGTPMFRAQSRAGRRDTAGTNDSLQRSDRPIFHGVLALAAVRSVMGILWMGMKWLGAGIHSSLGPSPVLLLGAAIRFVAVGMAGIGLVLLLRHKPSFMWAAALSAAC